MVGLNRFWFDFGFKLKKYKNLVWLVFLSKNQTELKMLTPSV
jgi:hypothetical protein